MIFLALTLPGIIAFYVLFVRPVLRDRPKLKQFYAEADGFWAKAWAICGKSLTLLWAYFLQFCNLVLQFIEPIGQVLGDPDIKQQITDAVIDPKVLGYVLMFISLVTIATRLRTLHKEDE